MHKMIVTRDNRGRYATQNIAGQEPAHLDTANGNTLLNQSSWFRYGRFYRRIVVRRNGDIINIVDTFIDEESVEEYAQFYPTKLIHMCEIQNDYVHMTPYGNELYGFFGIIDYANNVIRYLDISTDGMKLRVSDINTYEANIRTVRGSVCLIVSWDPVSNTLNKFLKYYCDGKIVLVNMNSGKSFSCDSLNLIAAYNSIIYVFTVTHIYRYDEDGKKLGESINHNYFHNFTRLNGELMAFTINIGKYNAFVGMYDLRTGNTYLINIGNECQNVRLLNVVH